MTEAEQIKRLQEAYESTGEPRVAPDPRFIHRLKGDLVRVVKSDHDIVIQREYLKLGMVLIIREDGWPDSDAEYAVAYINSDDAMDHGYAHFSMVQDFDKVTVAPVPVGPRRRKFDLR